MFNAEANWHNRDAQLLSETCVGACNNANGTEVGDGKYGVTGAYGRTAYAQTDTVGMPWYAVCFAPVLCVSKRLFNDAQGIFDNDRVDEQPY